MQKSRARRVGALIVGLSLLAAACGDDEEESTATEAPAAATTEAPAAVSRSPPRCARTGPRSCTRLRARSKVASVASARRSGASTITPPTPCAQVICPRSSKRSSSR